MSLLMLIDSFSRNESAQAPLNGQLWNVETCYYIRNLCPPYSLCHQIFVTIFSTTEINNYYVWLNVFMLVLINSYQAPTISGETIWLTYLYSMFSGTLRCWGSGLPPLFPLLWYPSTLIFTPSSKTFKYQFIVLVWLPSPRKTLHKSTYRKLL